MARVGDTLARRYELLEELGRGASGAVFKARDALLDTTVCIKVLIEGLAGDADVVERFKRELLIARKVSHPGVCKSFDLQTEGEAVFLVMEFVDGENLNDRLDRERPLALEDAVQIIRGAAQALGAAHEAGVVHRDLKPANILIRPDGSVSVVDFGIATATDMSKLTRPGLVLGSKKYVAPERWVGQEATPAVDVWSLGIILYGCLTGRLPYRGDGTFGVLDAIKTTTPPKPSELRPTLPKLLDDIVAKALAVEPTDRYPNAGALDEALSIIDDGAGGWSPTQVTPTPLPSIPALPDDPPTVGERPGNVGDDAPTQVGKPPAADVVEVTDEPATMESVGIPRDVTMESASAVPSQTAEADPAEPTAEAVVGRATASDDVEGALDELLPMGKHTDAPGGDKVAIDAGPKDGEPTQRGPIPGAPGWEPPTETDAIAGEEPVDAETAAALEAAAFQFELMPNTAPGVQELQEATAQAEAALKAQATDQDAADQGPASFEPDASADADEESSDEDLFAQVPDRSGGAKQADVETELVRKPTMAELSGPHAKVFHVPEKTGPMPGAPQQPPYRLIAAISGAVGLLLLLLVLWPSGTDTPNQDDADDPNATDQGDPADPVGNARNGSGSDAAGADAGEAEGEHDADAGAVPGPGPEPESEPDAWDFVDEPVDDTGGDEPEVAADPVADRSADPDPDVATKPGQNKASKTNAADKRKYIALKKQVANKMSARGLVSGDDRTLDGLRRKMSRSGRRGRYGEAAGLAQKALDRATKVPIDKALVSKKLQRLNSKYDQLQDASKRQQVTDALRAARKPFGAQDWEGANRALNRAFKALR